MKWLAHKIQVSITSNQEIEGTTIGSHCSLVSPM